ncbi:MAG TPA: alanine--tRNA ligase [Puia sp.]|nr:alanine--tRNA ligase [Puia sp.]
MMSSAAIRKKFLEFFQSKGHEIVPSAPIVVKNDPSLLFTNAGMNQFKDYFLGNKISPHLRVTDTQKCLRVSGKHNDLEEVGVDTYHHTMFEMLGNWSFGDYFKKDAIAWGWELLTAVYQIPPDRLYVTVFEGDPKENLPKDEEAYAEWKKWIPENRILMGNKKDNFWEMGDMGPCGPCTEIHVDLRSDENEIKKTDARILVNADHPQVIEIWNIVFIQYNRLKDGSLESLPSKHVDTGMGLERLTRVIQQKNSNYDTDLFTGTIAAVEKLAGQPYENTGSRKDIAFRVIADHVRAIAFTIADGQLPGNTGAGYVIRRILRRAVRYYYSYLDHKQPLLYELIPLIATQFEAVFPELQKQAGFVSKVVKEEEEGFLRTLDKGLKRIDDIIKSPGSSKIIPGRDAFELFDTYGFPLDLTRLIALENKLEVDETGFEQELEKQKQRSRAATAIDTEDWIVLKENPLTEFVGYDSLDIRTRLAKYRKVKARGKEAYQMVLEATPFYAESGGQVGDTGKLIFGDEPVEVMDTKKEHDLIIHVTDKLPADLLRDVMAIVDPNKRKNTEVHHSATHLLHAALRKVLGTHVAQKGSLVNEEHLRFDFAHFAKVSEAEIAQVESIVNEKIRENIPVVVREMTKVDALKLGAMALFGEKYGDRVRVVIIEPAFSVELCGGTHVGATGELGFFKIRHESAVAAGVRRIEAVSGKSAEAYIEEQYKSLALIRDAVKSSKDIVKAVEVLASENSELKKKIESLEAKQLQATRQAVLQRVRLVNGIHFIGEQVEVSHPDALKKLCFELKPGLENYLIVLAAIIDGKAQVAIALDEKTAAARSLDAQRIIKEQVAPLIKGGGGGQKTLATAGGQDGGNLQGVIEAVLKLIS